MSDIADEVLEMMRELSTRVTEDVQPDEFTINMFVENTGVDKKKADRLLNSLVEEGELLVRTAYDPTSGRVCKAYRKAQK